MYYFDNIYLQQYIDQGVKLKVFDGYDWFDVVDRSDLNDPVKGNGYDASGQDHYFVYKDVEKISVGNRIFTLDQLQTQRTGEPAEDEAEDKEPAPKGEDEPDLEGPPEDEESSDERGIDLSWHSPVYNVGRELIAEYRKQKK